MGKILTNVTGMHEHYITASFAVKDFDLLANANITSSAATVTGQSLSNVIGVFPTLTAFHKIFISVDSITDITSPITVTLKVSAVSVGEAVIPAHCPIDALIPVKLAGVFTNTSLTSAYTMDLAATALTPGVVLSVLALDETTSKWNDLGLNYNEGLSFEDGAMRAPVGRGWDATAMSLRIPSSGSFQINQLYCSAYEGVASLRGKTLMIRDDIRPDGGATVKESWFMTNATVQNVSVAVGGGGGAASADAVNCSGYYKRSLCWNQDAVAITAL